MRQLLGLLVLCAALPLAGEDVPTIEQATGLAMQGDLEGARAALDADLAANAGNARILYQRALVLYAMGELDPALADLSKAIEIDPRFLGAHRLRGAVMHRWNRFPDAIAEYDHVLELAPGDGECYAGRMAARFASGDLVGGLADYRAALVDSASADAFRRLLTARIGPSFRSQIAALEAAPDAASPTERVTRAQALLAGAVDAVFPVLPAPEEAAKLATEAEEQAKKDGDTGMRVVAAVQLGRALEHPLGLSKLKKEEQQDRIHDARAAYLRAIEADGKNPTGYWAWAESFLAAQRQLEAGADLFGGALDYLGEAQDLLESALKDCGETAELHRLLGSVLEAKGNLDLAVAEYEKAIALDPKGHVGYACIAGLHLRRENAAEKALAALDREVAACGADDEASLARAFCLIRLGKKDDAAAVLRAVLPRVALSHPIAADGDLAQLLKDAGLLH